MTARWMLLYRLPAALAVASTGPHASGSFSASETTVATENRTSRGSIR